MKTSDHFTFGLDNELVLFSKYSHGWNHLDIPKKYKNKENYETYCYLKYAGMDADAIFLAKLKS